MEQYTWNSKTNAFDGYIPQYETQVNEETGEEVQTLLPCENKVWTDEEVKALFSSVGKDQALRDVDGQPTIVDLYNAKEKAIKSKEARIAELKGLLKATDYQAIKFAEGVWTAEEYEEVRVQRQMWRDEINACENYIATAKIHEELE